MPPIRSQTVNLDGVTLVTQAWGTLVVRVFPGIGPRTEVTITQDGVQINQASVNNATPAGLELVINGLLNPSALATVGLVGMAFNILTHVVTVDPFSAAWISSDPVPPADWWQ
jgi:hypothetical protein